MRPVFKGVRLRSAAAALSLAVLLPAFPLAAASPSPSEARGDAAWQRRAEGFLTTGRVEDEPAREAVEAYEEALAADPENLPLRFKLIEALYFLGHFATADAKEARRIFQHQVAVARTGVLQIERRAGLEGGAKALPLEARAERLAGIPEAPRAYFWDAISWGLWAMSHSMLASATKNVGGKIRDDAHLVALLDERFADGGGWRLLGRLHTKTPRVPMFSAWVDPEAGIGWLYRARQISDRDPRNALYLAEALLDHHAGPEAEAEALELLQQVSRRDPAPDHLVEETEILEQARRALDGLRTVRTVEQTATAEAGEAAAPAAQGSGS